MTSLNKSFEVRQNSPMAEKAAVLANTGKFSLSTVRLSNWFMGLTAFIMGFSIGVAAYRERVVNWVIF